MIIRDFAERDVESACSLTNYYILNTVIHFGTQPAQPSEFRQMWLDGAAKYPWVAAEVDGRFAGYAKASRWRERDAYKLTAEVGLYVESSFHRRGIGSELYREVLNRLRAASFHTAIGGITLPNAASERLHESLGFTRVATFRQVGRKFDAWHDVGFWQLML